MENNIDILYETTEQFCITDAFLQRRGRGAGCQRRRDPHGAQNMGRFSARGRPISEAIYVSSTPELGRIWQLPLKRVAMLAISQARRREMSDGLVENRLIGLIW